MAGVVAMASVIEDFDTQPCKKSRKDGGSPVVKMITNYFSPVPKPAEKPFSPPRSNNIMDYFSRKAPSSKEKPSPPQDLKENRQKPEPEDKRGGAEAGKKPSEKRGRKASRVARKLEPTEAVGRTDDGSCPIVEETQESKGAAGSNRSLGGDAAALLSKLSAETCESEKISKTVSDEQTGRDSPQEREAKCENSDDLKPKLNTNAVSPRVDVKRAKKARKATKRQQKETTHPEPEEKEAEGSLCDVSMEVSSDDASQLNSSTVTVSFEEFVRSQNQDTKDDQGERKNAEKPEQLNREQQDGPKADDSAGPAQVSPRTLTIQAEVHAVARKRPAVKAGGKLASIFTRGKGPTSPAEPAASPPADDLRRPPSASPTVKRRSNVVLREEDLELAVLESESAPKCSEAERKQFMAAFKQPGADGSRAKAVRSKQKQAEETAAEEADKAAEGGDVLLPPGEQGSQDGKASQRKRGKKGRNKAKDKHEAARPCPAASAAKETEITAVEAEDEEEGPPISSAPTVPALRRSRRETAAMTPPENTPTSPGRKTRRQKDAKEAGRAASPPLSPANTSTPRTRRSRHGVFVAEMVCPPDASESPIRMRLSRVPKKVRASKAESGDDMNASSNNKTLTEAKKRQQAKKLVEKARMIQQSKKTTQKETLRRSSRTNTSAKKSYCEDEDSVICVEDLTTTPQSAPERHKAQKSLRSLNEVLGKEPRTVPAGLRAASSGQDRSARKAPPVISIFDDSSREEPENSEDGEQSRARREFLKSGLPESFRKQMAKTAATKEAYSASSLSFQPVSHTTQPPHDCPLWSLPWPESSLLGHLKDLWSHTQTPPPPVSGSLSVQTEPANRSHNEKGSVPRPEISEDDRQLLMKEFCSRNPHFPAQMLFSRLQKRRADLQQRLSASEPDSGSKGDSPVPLPDETVGGKRKRKEEERENNVKVAKKQKPNHSEEVVSPAEQEAPRRGGRTRRARRSRIKEDKEETKAPVPSEEDSVIVVDDFAVVEAAGRTESAKEELLWTDKYQPQLSSDIVDNTPAVRRLYSWLKDWKLRADRDERKNQRDRKQEEGSDDSEWDRGEDDYQDADDALCNTVLITGPTGVGKTAAVYACAQELGFKVFEVNASSQRSGRLILSQLKEATQSHQVDSQGVNAHKPAYFTSYGSSSSAGSARPGSSPRKANSPRTVVSSPRKRPQSPRRAKKGCLAPTSLAKFFKTVQPANKEPDKPDREAPCRKAVKASSDKNKWPAAPVEKSNEEQSKKSATSLILFEEVDVIFDDDSGFLAAIKTFMSTTKRPVILTTSDPTFSALFDGNFEEIHFKKPSVANVGSYLQLLCLAEDMRTHPSDVSSLLKLNGCDIRQSLLQLQFWARSAGGRPSPGPLVQTGLNETKADPEAAEASAAVPSSLPPCGTGCTQSKLGLLNIEPDRDVWQLLRSECLLEAPVCWELLTDSRRRGVDLLYSNMENLLPLPVTQLSTSKPTCCPSASQDLRSESPRGQPPSPSLRSDAPPPGAGPSHAADSADCSDGCSPVKVSSGMRRNKTRHRLPARDGLRSDSDSEDGFPSLCRKQEDPQMKEVKEGADSERVKRKPPTAEEQIKSVPVSQCLRSIADFWDDMSYVDSSLRFPPEGLNTRRSSVSAAIKDGMTDEWRIEAGRESWATGSRVLEIQAAVEALSFHRCRASAADAWDKTQQLAGALRREAAEELTLPLAAHREGCSFTQEGLSQPRLAQRRKEVMESLFFKVFGTLGNRQAAAVDYLPAMRTVCRAERLKEQGKVKRRFLHYLDAIHLGLEKSTLRFLAEDFP